jgi:caa(3)-type oxidase subunit IV
MSEHSGAHEHEHPNYVRVWAVLLALLVVSVTGPMAGIKIVTLITAFGVACFKAYLVARNFMHINVERRYISYIVMTVLVFVVLFFAGTAPDVMKDAGTQWEKPSWRAESAATTPAAHGGAQH